MKDLLDHLPIYRVEQDMLLSKLGDITLVYRLVLPELFTLSDGDYANLHQRWIRAIELLPSGTHLHKQDWFVTDRFMRDIDLEQDFLSRSSDRYFHERPFLSHQGYLLLTLSSAGRSQVNSYFSSLLKKHFVPVETLDPAFAKSFSGVCSQFVKLLTEGGLVGCQRVEGGELEALVTQYLSLATDGVKRDIDFSQGVTVGEKYCTLFSLADLQDFPSHCGPRIGYDPYSTTAGQFPVGFAAALGPLLCCDHIYQQFIRVEDPATVSQALERRRLRLQSLALYGRSNQVARDVIEQFLQEMAVGQGVPVRAHFQVLAWTSEAESLPAIRNQCAAALASIQARPKIETVGAPQLYWAGIPGNAADLPMNDTVLLFAHQAACFLLTETSYTGSVSSFGVRLGDRLSGRPMQVDLSDGPMQAGIISNRNKFILGPSGSGKSFFTNHLLRSYYHQGAHIVLVDIGHSYQGLCQLLGGTYFSYSQHQRISFNPFSGELDQERKESIKALLVTLWKKDDETFRRSEYVALSNALQLYYHTAASVRSFDLFYEFLRDEFAVVIDKDKVKVTDFDLANFLYVLRPYYRGGEFDYLLNAREDMDLLEQRFIVFELDTIKDHPILFPVVTMVIMELFLAKIRRLKGVRKIILIEEAWKAIAKAGMAEYIRYLYKTIRKHYGEPIVVTQELDDILSSAIVKQTIIAMSDCKILFDQSRYEQDFTQVQELLGLGEQAKLQVLSLNKANEPGKLYKEVFIALGQQRSKVYRVEVSPEEYLAYTTEEKEKLAVTIAAEQLGSIEAGIKHILHEKI